MRKNKLFLLLAFFLLIAIPLTVWAVKTKRLEIRKRAEEGELINFLEYLLPDEGKKVTLCTDNNQGGCLAGAGVGDVISKFKIGNNLLVSKSMPEIYEHLSWDNEYIYLNYDSSLPASYYECDGKGTSYGFTNGKWAKRKMRVGEQIIANDNNIVYYSEDDCSICEGPYPCHYLCILEARYPNFNVGGELGLQMLLSSNTNTASTQPPMKDPIMPKAGAWLNGNYMTIMKKNMRFLSTKLPIAALFFLKKNAAI